MFFIDTKKCENCLQILNEKFESTFQKQFFRENKISLYLIDTQKLPYFKKYYKLTDNISFKFFINTQMNDFKFLDKRMKQDFVSNELESFILSKINNIVIDLISYDTLVQKVKEHGIIAVYFGR